MTNSTILELILTAKDEASEKVKQLNENMEGLNAPMAKIGVAAGVAFGIIATVVDKSVEAAADAQKVQAQLQAVLKSTGEIAGVTAESANELGEALMKTTTFSKEAVISTESLLLTFTKIGKETMPQATETVLDMATALGEDTKSAAIQLGKALQDPVLGITALRKVGVNFSEDQRNVIKQLVATGQSAQAQQIILKELNTEFGGSASAAANTYAGKMTQLSNTVDDVEQNIGGALLPVLQQLLTAILPVVQKLSEWIAEHPTLVKWIIAIAGAVTGFIAILSGLGVVIALVTAVSSPWLLIIGAIILAIGAVIAITILLVKNWDNIRAYFKTLWQDIENIFETAINNIISFFDNLLSKVTAVISKVGSVASAIGGAVTAPISGLVSFASSAISGKKALGGNVSGGSTYLVGEAGPELFTASQTGSIVPNGRARGGGGSTIIVDMSRSTFLSKDVATQIGNMIVNKLKTQSRLGY